jgi:hypothetical protein
MNENIPNLFFVRFQNAFKKKTCNKRETQQKKLIFADG